MLYVFVAVIRFHVLSRIDRLDCRTSGALADEAEASSRATPRNGTTSQDLETPETSRQIATAVLEEAVMAKEAMQQELALMRSELSAARAGQEEAESEVKELSAALAGERDKVFKLEIEVSELRTKLQTLDELEFECRKYKEMLAERESKAAGGLWGYISGAS
jgi:chromosome segregation ATPase